jgi:hypothetical protein
LIAQFILSQVLRSADDDPKPIQYFTFPETYQRKLEAGLSNSSIQHHPSIIFATQNFDKHMETSICEYMCRFGGLPAIQRECYIDKVPNPSSKTRVLVFGRLEIPE